MIALLFGRGSVFLLVLFVSLSCSRMRLSGCFLSGLLGLGFGFGFAVMRGISLCLFIRGWRIRRGIKGRRGLIRMGFVIGSGARNGETCVIRYFISILYCQS